MHIETSKPNRLIHERSPYLLQHAHNPVDWYPWGSEAFEKARAEDKPLLLSIGYSTCHWCHVMENESFADPEIASLMNRYFVCIKVDREERPDLDKIYITAVTSLTGSAGWPLNVFLTPDLKPFFGGTYFPPRSRMGIVAWPDLVKLIGASWDDSEKKQKIIDSADSITRIIENHLARQTRGVTPGADLLETAYQYLTTSFDNHQGGFSPAPKFPSPAIQSFLLSYGSYAQTVPGKSLQAGKAMEMAAFTLRSMAQGGLYDHLGGGFHRYSTDDRWHVPHFEKMLYDNAQLITNYLEAYQITRDPMFAQIAQETVEYILRDMTHPDGGFYSAEDADSLPAIAAEALPADGKPQKVEGAFYVWTFHEIEAILGRDVNQIFSFHFGLHPEGNVRHDPHGEFKGQNILFGAHSIEETAKAFKMSVPEVEQVLQDAKTKLFHWRIQRARPHLDDKIITSWNGLMISALAKAHQILGKEKYLIAARNAAEFIRKNIFDSNTQQLFRRWRDNEAKIPGMASDYAFLVQALIDLYESDFDSGWIDWAVVLAEKQLDLFYDKENGGFFMTHTEHDPNLIMRVKEDSDSPIPAAGSVAVLNYLRLARLIGRSDFEEAAGKTLKHQDSRTLTYPFLVPQMLVALIYSISNPLQVIIAGPRTADQTASLLDTVRSLYINGKTLMLVEDGNRRSIFSEHLPYIESVQTVEGLPAAYVCSGHSCKPPVTRPEDLKTLLAAGRQKQSYRPHI